MITFPHLAFDINLVLFFNQFCGKSKFLDSLALVFLSVDAIRTAILVALVIGIWEYGRVKNDIDSSKRVLLILFSILLSLGVIECLNAVIDSPRPIVTYERNILSPIVEDKNMKELWKDGWARNSKHGSFPSDTIALLATMASGLFFWRKKIGVLAFLIVIFGGVLPRLYFGLHYPSDMFIGILISVISTIIIEKNSFLNNIINSILELNKKHPYIFGVVGFYIAYIIADKFILIRKLPLWFKSMIGR